MKPARTTALINLLLLVDLGASIHKHNNNFIYPHMEIYINKLYISTVTIFMAVLTFKK